VADKFGQRRRGASPLGIPESKMAISVNLTDPDRVAGFVNPGRKWRSSSRARCEPRPPGAAPPERATQTAPGRVTVLGVGSTTPVTTTTTAEDGTQQTEQLPRTLLTLALSQEEAQKVILASKNLELTSGC
jgi:pilus assembly protein CpaB